MTLKQYRSLDLLLFSIIAVVFEVINRFANVSITNFKLMFLSFSIVLTLISMYRWGFLGIVVYLFSKTIAVAISPNNKEIVYYVSYIIGGALGIILEYIIFQKIIGKKRIKKVYLLLPYLVFDFLAVMVFMSIFAGFFNIDNFGQEFTKNFQSLLIQESMSLFTSSIILLIANRKNGYIMVEMQQYVRDVQEGKKLGGLKEMREQSNFNSDGPYTEYDQNDYSTLLDGGHLSEKQLKELAQMFENNVTINIDSSKTNEGETKENDSTK